MTTIMLCGPSGTGKTTLAQWIAKKYDLKFIPTSSKVLWKKYGIADHAHLIRKSIGSPMWGYKFQEELLDYREDVMAKNFNYITDRSPIDNMVYFLLQVTPHISYKLTENYIDRCKSLIDRNNHNEWLFHLPFNKEVIKLEDDKARIINPIYQECTQLYFDYCIAQIDKTIIKLDTWDFEKKIKIVQSYLGWKE